MRRGKQEKGFTLLEILLVIAAIGILAAIVLIAINPNKQIEAARSAQRRSDINTITKAIQQYSIDNGGIYPNSIDIGAKVICPTSNPPVGCVDLSLLAPTYIASIPQADTGYYYVKRNSAGTNIQVTHPKDSIWNIAGTPSLDLNFASNKSLIDSVSGNNLITFTRASTGTYIGEDGLIKTAAINEPRFDHNPVTQESLGLLIEEGRVNYHRYSSNFTNWTSNQGASTFTNAPDIVAPDGSQTVKLLYGQMHRGSETGPGAGASFPFRGSIFVKRHPLGSNTIDFILTAGGGDSAVTFNFDTEGIVNASGSPQNLTVTKFGNGWYRIGFNITPSTVSWRPVIGGTPSATSYCYVWGMQIENATFDSSYIPTTNSTVTRAADNASITGTNFTSGWYNQTQGTILSAARMVFNTSGNSLFPDIYTMGSFPDRLLLLYLNQPGFNSLTVGADTYSRQLGNFSTSPQIFKVAQAISNTSLAYSASKDGATALTGSMSRAITNVSSISMGGGSGATKHIARLTYWPTQLSNSILQSITQ